MAHTITSAQAKAELARRQNNKSGKAYQPAANEEVRLATGKALKDAARTEKATVKAVKVQVKVAKKQTAQVSKQVLKARKAFEKALATEGLSAAYRAYKKVMA